MGVSVTALRRRLTGGGARPSLFYAKVQFPGGLLKKILNLDEDAQDDITFFMQNAVIPESTLQTVTQPFLGRNLKIPSIDRDFQSFQTQILNDENYRIRHFFESWIEILAPGKAIFEATSDFGGNGTDNGQVFGGLEVHQMTKSGGVSSDSVNGSDRKYLGSYYFVDAYPTQVSDITLSWGEQNTIETFGVTFDYQYWHKIPDKQPEAQPYDETVLEKIDKAENWAGVDTNPN